MNLKQNNKDFRPTLRNSSQTPEIICIYRDITASRIKRRSPPRQLPSAASANVMPKMETREK